MNAHDPRGSHRRQLLAAAAAGCMLPRPVLAQGPSLRLPAAEGGDARSVAGALARRRSVRSFAGDALALVQVSELLWAAQGLSEPRGLRTAPSAGALYPLEVHLIARRVGDLRSGVYAYLPREHALEARGELPAGWPSAIARQDWIAAAPLVLVIASVTARTAARYGERAARYVAIEAGAAAQNVALRATSLALGCTFVGAFDDQAVRRMLRLAPGTDPLLLMPVGRGNGAAA